MATFNDEFRRLREAFDDLGRALRDVLVEISPTLIVFAVVWLAVAIIVLLVYTWILL